MGIVRAPDHSARCPVRLFRFRPDTGVRSHLSAGPDFLELGGLPLHGYHLHGYHLLSYGLYCAGSSCPDNHGSEAAPHRTGDVPSGTLGGVPYTPPSAPDICAYSGSAKTKRASPWGAPSIPGMNPSVQAPHPTGTAMYCLPSTL